MSRMWCDNPSDHRRQANRDFERRGHPDYEHRYREHDDACSEEYMRAYRRAEEEARERRDEEERQEARRQRAERDAHERQRQYEEDREYYREQERYEEEEAESIGGLADQPPEGVQPS